MKRPRAIMNGQQPLCPPRARAGFTLIELILVMTILTIAVSLTAPSLANFFRWRTLDSEARRLLSLTRQGQSRAVSEGLPMELWFDSAQAKCGLEAEPSFEASDAKAVSFNLDKDVQLEITNPGQGASAPQATLSASGMDSSSSAPVTSSHPNLPRIRFMPDGSIAETSPQMVHLVGHDGTGLWLVLARNHQSYEIRTRIN